MALEFNPRAYSQWLNTAEAAVYLGLKPGTLKNWRHRGEGPRYRVINSRLIRYHCSDLDSYAIGGLREPV